MSHKEKSKQIEKAISEFNRIMLKKKLYESVYSWNLSLHECKKEVRQVSKKFNVSENLIKKITQIKNSTI